MMLLFSLLALSLPNTLVCYGNTHNGLGMMVGEGYIEIGVYENEKIINWKIQSFPEEGYFEEIWVNNQVRSLKVEKIANGKFQYEIKHGRQGEKGVLEKDNKKIIFNKLRNRLLKGVKSKGESIAFKKNMVKEKGNGFEIEIKITKQGQAVFKETRKKHGEKKSVICRFETLLK